MIRKLACIGLFASLLMLTGCSHFKKAFPDDPVEEEEVLPVKVESEKVENPKDSENAIKEFIASQALAEQEANEKEPEKPKIIPPYTLNLGDVLEISILDEPDMTRDVKIIPDGTLTYLLVGEILAEGKTIKELRADLTTALDEYYIAPYVSILTKELFVPEDEEKRVAVLGALKSPGNYKWHKGDRVIDVIAEAGGLLYTQTEFGARTIANLKASYISRDGKELDVDFYRLLQLGDMKQNIKMEPADFVYIANSEDSNIVVMGEVNSPKILPYTRDISLIEALSMCGGFTREAYQSRVVILRPSDDDTKYVEVNVNDLLHGRDIRNIQLEGGDIIFIPEQGISEYARYAGYLTTMMEAVIKGYELRDAIRFPQLKR